uniref:Secreted protein n=1 Tax=Mesocestoides corti TaxID=53468 RepID=A0A5K3FQN2_MESCO
MGEIWRTPSTQTCRYVSSTSGLANHRFFSDNRRSRENSAATIKEDDNFELSPVNAHCCSTSRATAWLAAFVVVAAAATRSINASCHFFKPSFPHPFLLLLLHHCTCTHICSFGQFDSPIICVRTQAVLSTVLWEPKHVWHSVDCV